MTPVIEVIASAEARKKMPSFLEDFREHGADAKPVVFGAHRKPEGVMLAYERYERIIGVLDDLVIREEVEERLAGDTGERISFEDVARGLGFDPADFGRE